MIRRPPRSTLSLHDALPISLDAVIQTFNAVSMLRQQVRPECRIHGIITNGGAAPNIIPELDRKSTRLNSSHSQISYAVFCLKKKKNQLSGQPTSVPNEKTTS